MMAGGSGTFVLAWHQTVIDGRLDAPEPALRQGSAWDYQGHAMRLDGPAGILPLVPLPEDAARKARAGQGLRRRLGLRAIPTQSPDDLPDLGPDGGFVLTDGRHQWVAALVRRGATRAPLILFEGPPPAEADLWVVAVVPPRGAVGGTAPAIVASGLSTGTTVSLAGGPAAPVETVRQGDLLALADGGHAEVLWAGQHRISGARMQAMPALQPLRLRPGVLGPCQPQSGLVLPAGQRLRLSGARPLFSCDQVLVAAGDLESAGWLTRDRHLPGLTLHRILLSRPGLILAQGLAVESFRPQPQDMTAMAPDDRAALRLAMAQVDWPDAPLLRVLTASEAALLAWPAHRAA